MGEFPHHSSGPCGGEGVDRRTGDKSICPRQDHLLSRRSYSTLGYYSVTVPNASSVLTGEAGPRQEGRKRGSREGSKQDQGATSEWETGASAQGLLPVSPGAGPSTLHSYRPAWGWGCWQASEGRHPPQGPSPPSMEVQVAAPGPTRGGLPCVPSRRPWKLCSSQEFLQVTQEGHRDGSCPPSPCNVTGLLMRAANHPEIKEPMSGEAGSQEPLGLKSAP